MFVNPPIPFWLITPIVTALNYFSCLAGIKKTISFSNTSNYCRDTHDACLDGTPFQTRLSNKKIFKYNFVDSKLFGDKS